GLVLAAHGDDRHHGAEGLLALHGHVGRDARDHGGLVVVAALVALALAALAADEDPRPALARLVDLPAHDLELHAVGHAAHVDVVAAVGALAQAARLLDEALGERAGQRLVHVDPLDRRAH